MQRSSWYHVRSILRQVWTHPSNAHRRWRATGAALRWQVDKRLVARPRDIVFFGFILRCYPDSNSASNVIYFGERFDPEEMGVLSALLDPGDGFLDVGANIGTYTLFARSLVGSSGRVDAFEAHPKAAARLRENLEINSITNVVVHEVAVASEPGLVSFLDDFDVSNSIITEKDRGANTVEVTAAAIDDVVADCRYAVGKMDIEGFEPGALIGARARLQRGDPPVWLIEVMEWQLAKAGSSAAALVGLLEDHGFEVTRFDPPSGRCIAVQPDEPMPNHVWAIKPAHLDRINLRLQAARAADALDLGTRDNAAVFDDTTVVTSYLAPDELTPAEEHLFGHYLRPGSDLLDLGVGTGRTTAALRAVSGSYVGVDLSPQMIAAARQRFPDADLQVADAADLARFPTGSFDAVVFSFNGLDYVPLRRRNAAVREIRRVLRPGGVFIMSTHNPRAVIRPPDPTHGAKAPAISAYRTLRRLRRLGTGAFWTGSGMVWDPIKDGLDTHMSTPGRLTAELAAHGLTLIETVGAEHPRRSSPWATEWNYFAFRAAASDTP